MAYFEDNTISKKTTAALLLYTQLEHDNKRKSNTISYIYRLSGKFLDALNIFNRKRTAVKMNIHVSGFAKIFHETIGEIS